MYVIMICILIDELELVRHTKSISSIFKRMNKHPLKQLSILYSVQIDEITIQSTGHTICLTRSNKGQQSTKIFFSSKIS
jgi:hypothetical protein